MVVKVKNVKGGVSVQEVLKEQQKSLGTTVGSFGGLEHYRVKIPTGLFQLDLALGGGFPKGVTSILYGAEDCLSGDTFVNYSVRNKKGKPQNKKGGLLKHLYHRFTGTQTGQGAYQRKQTLGSEFYAPCMAPDGSIFHNRIVNVVNTGQKDVFHVTTDDGQSLKATENHKFFDGEAYVRLGDLVPGDEIFVHNHTRYTGRVPRLHRPSTTVKHHPYGGECIVEGKYVYRRVYVSRLNAEARLNDLSPEQYRQRLNEGMLAGLIFLKPEQQVHHIDEDPYNNAPKNLVVMTRGEHQKYHANMGQRKLSYLAVPARITGITHVGVEETYDISMEAPHNNYIANGFVVHNSSKTTIALLAIAQHQKLWPKETCVFIAIEPFSPKWAKKLGVDLEKLVVLYPAYAEEAVDLVEQMLFADDCGMVVLDSVGAMISTQEADKSAEGDNPGKMGLIGGKLVRKTALALREAEKVGRHPTFLMINQIRMKIGVMFGSPETLPGGMAQMYQAQLIVRLYGKNIIDKKVSEDFPVRREITFGIKKFKDTVPAMHGKTEIVVREHDGLRVGESHDVNTVYAYLDMYGAVTKLKQGYKILDDEYPTQGAFKARLLKDRAFARELKAALIERVVNDMDAEDEAPDEYVDADGVLTEAE